MFYLKKLIIKNNEINVIDFNVFKELKNLTYFDLSYNQIELLPKNIDDGLFHLKYLFLFPGV